MILRGSELWKLSTCNVKVSLKYIEVFALRAESCLSGRAYMGEVAIQISLKSMQK